MAVWSRACVHPNPPTRTEATTPVVHRQPVGRTRSHVARIVHTPRRRPRRHFDVGLASWVATTTTTRTLSVSDTLPRSLKFFLVGRITSTTPASGTLSRSDPVLLLAQMLFRYGHISMSGGTESVPVLGNTVPIKSSDCVVNCLRIDTEPAVLVDMISCSGSAIPSF